MMDFLTVAALLATTAASGTAAMIGWWNWKHLEEVKEDVKAIKAHADRQLRLRDHAEELREQSDTYRSNN